MIRRYRSERTTQPKQYFFSVDFLFVIIYQNFFFVYMQKYSFSCVNPLLFLLPFVNFIVLLPLSMIFRSNFGLNFNTVRAF